MMFNKMLNRIKETFMVSGYSQTVKELRKLSDRQLVDIGISRDLLKLGAKGYPWREEKVLLVVPNNVTNLHTKKIIANTPIMPRTPKAA